MTPTIAELREALVTLEIHASHFVKAGAPGVHAALDELEALRAENERQRSLLAMANHALKTLAPYTPEVSEGVVAIVGIIHEALSRPASPTDAAKSERLEAERAELLAALEQLADLVDWWAPKDGVPRTADERALLQKARTP